MFKVSVIQRVLAAILLSLALAIGTAQNVLQNPSFEAGTNSPSAWGVSGIGAWATLSRTGARSGALASAPGVISTWSSFAPIEGNRAYVIRCWTRSTNGASGYCNGSLNNVSRDFPRPPSYWQEFSMAAWVPASGFPYFSWNVFGVDGTNYVDDAEVLPLNAIHKRVGPYQLGSGEGLTAGHYLFRAPYADYGANYARPLFAANAAFKISRWQMAGGSQIIYRHFLDGMVLSNAQVSCGVWNYAGASGTTLSIEASTNGTTWLPVDSMLATVTNSSVVLPASLLPSPVMFIRLSSTNIVNFMLTDYAFSANISDTGTSGSGETHYFGDFMTNSSVSITSAETTPAGHLVSLAIPNRTATNQTFQIIAATTYSTNSRTRSANVSIAAGSTNQTSILLPTAGFGNNNCMLTVKDGAGTNVFQQDVTLDIRLLADDSYGEALPGPAYAPVWWCDGGYKIGRSRSLPLATNTAVHIAAARNEYEPFQLVIRPMATLSNVTASIGDFISLSNSAVVVAATNVTISHVGYVNVTQIMNWENFSVTGEHPDPLVPLTGPFDAPGQTNTVLWFTVHVPKQVPSGEYQASVTVNSSAGTFTVPVQLKVFGFSLTDVTHTPTAYGIVLPYTWHALQNASPGQQQAVWEFYMANMARHRISPLFPQWCSLVAWNYNPDKQSFNPTYADFDNAMERYLEEYNFTSFKDANFYRELPPIPGMSAIVGTNINPAYRPIYPRIIQPLMQHLREKGWAARAYSFWIDEPQPAQFPLVREGMRMVEETAPDLDRHVASFTGLESELSGYINRWSILMPSLDTNAAIARQMAGDEVWGYVATQPRAPWPNNFIDHPAINPRARAWLSLRMGLTGEEYYGINYYLGTTNVWTNPMSSTDQTRPDNFNWGNGDGTLVYPPVKEYPGAPLIAGPFDSVRWEMIREAQEDREYFWSLDRLVALRESVLGVNHPAIVEARAAKAAAMSLVSQSPAELYPYEPEKFYNARLRLGAAIEGLDDGAPFVAKQPLSKTALAGTTETLRVEASGWPGPTVQWQHAGTNLPGEVRDKLVLTNLDSNLAGNYTAVVSNSSGITISAVGRITVYDASSLPQVVAQSTGSIRTNGSRAIFWVGASSVTPMTYQWLFEGVPLVGATNMVLILTDVSGTNNGFYSVVIGNSVGTATNTPASLYVVSPGSNTVPLITAQPAGQIRLPGQSAQFAVSVVGLMPIGCQWYFNTNTPLPGETGSTLSLPGVQAHQFGTYTLRATNFAGAVTSSPALLQVPIMPRYTNEAPGYAIAKNGSGFRLALAPDNRLRTVLTSTNLRDWTLLYTIAPSVMPMIFPVGANNEARRFFRLQASLQSAPMPNYTNQPPGMTGAWSGIDYILTLAPDNRPRSVLSSTNMRDWALFYTPNPSALPEVIPTISENSRQQFFRLVANP